MLLFLCLKCLCTPDVPRSVSGPEELHSPRRTPALGGTEGFAKITGLLEWSRVEYLLEHWSSGSMASWRRRCIFYGALCPFHIIWRLNNWKQSVHLFCTFTFVLWTRFGVFGSCCFFWVVSGHNRSEE